ncbi:MAG: alpha-hydroxy-acid oxidizing protein, partial [Acidimicrobiales bacterium]
MAKDLLDEYPAISDLEQKTSRRIPHFAWEYLDQGTGADQARDCNRESLAQVQFLPQFFKGLLEPRITTELFGVEYAAPIGIAPVG